VLRCKDTIFYFFLIAATSPFLQQPEVELIFLPSVYRIEVKSITLSTMKKEEFKQKTRDVLDELADYITKLENKAGEIAEDAKEEYRDRLENLKEIKNNLASKLEEYEQIADSKWDVVKESAGSFFTTVADAWKENFGKVAEAFKKEKNEECDDDSTTDTKA